MAKAKARKAKPQPRNKKLYDDGMKVRKAVLGAAYVDNSLAGAANDEFMMAFQDITTEYCWGYAWTRPGLSKKTRSMLNLAMLAALNRSFPKEVTWNVPDGGMFIWLEFPESVDATALLERAIKDTNVAFVPGSAFYATEPKRNTARLSFSLGQPERIEEGIERLAALVQNTLRANSAAAE